MRSRFAAPALRTALAVATLTMITPVRSAGEHTNPAGQDRTVTASSSAESELELGPDDDDARHASGYGLFDETVETESDTHYAYASATASQTSIIEHSSMSASGSVSFHASVSPVVGIEASSQAVSRFKFAFGISRPTQFHVEAGLIASGSATAKIEIRRYDEVWLAQSISGGDSTRVADDRTLEPGVYDIRVEAIGFASPEVYSESGSASFSMSMGVDRIVPVGSGSWSELKSRY